MSNLTQEERNQLVREIQSLYAELSEAEKDGDMYGTVLIRQEIAEALQELWGNAAPSV